MTCVQCMHAACPSHLLAGCPRPQCLQDACSQAWQVAQQRAEASKAQRRPAAGSSSRHSSRHSSSCRLLQEPEEHADEKRLLQQHCY
jgi:hypothetical protein